MYKNISYEKALEMGNTKVNSLPIYKEASELGNCELLLNTNIIPSPVSILIKESSLKDDVIGLLVSIDDSYTYVYAAIDSNYGIRDSLHITQMRTSSSLTISEILNKSLEAANRCPECGKEVKFKDQKQVSFAGRCCPECYPAMKKEHEYPGWYN